MRRSFSIVDYKVRQAEFFLREIQNAGLDFFAAQCFTDAFVSAARSVTFALQSVCVGIPGFAEWYCVQQARLRTDSIAEFFNRYRTASIHIGDTVVRGGASHRDADGRLQVTYFFIDVPDIPDPPTEDVYTACRTYFATILRIVLGAYRTFATHIDDRWHFTAENFLRLGKSIEDAEDQLGFPRGWTDLGEPALLVERWRAIRATQTVGCEIDDLFQKYLGEHFPGPDDDA